MYLDVVDLKTFYDLPLGRMLRVIVGQRLRAAWPTVAGQRVLGLGYAGPYLRPFMDEAERALAAMPAAQGVVAWPRERDNSSALVDETNLPFPDNTFDRLLIVHAIDHCRDPEEMLRDAWRVLAPGGKIVVVVANRRGLWARTETSPFGYGRPYSRGQLEALLKNCHFLISASDEALFLPPTRSRFLLRSARTWERVGRRLWPAFAGLLVIEAEKQLYRGIAVGEKKRARVLKPVFVPRGAAGVNGRSECPSPRGPGLSA